MEFLSLGKFHVKGGKVKKKSSRVVIELNYQLKTNKLITSNNG